MRILHILNHIQKIGNGIVHVAIDLACKQAQSGHAVAVVSGGGEYEALLAEYGVIHFHLDQTRRPIVLLKAAQTYRQIVHQFQPDIVHAHMMTGVVLAWSLRRTVRLSRSSKAPSKLASTKLSTDRFINPSTHPYKLIATVHNEFQSSAILMGLADRVIAVSQPVAVSMQQRGIPADKLCVIRNGTLGSPRQTASYSPLPLDRPAIVTVAGMYQRKGIAELIAAFAQTAVQLPQSHLYLIGDGPDRHAFEQQAQQTAVPDRIHFTGFQTNPQHYLSAADIFVLASHREPFGLVLSEAREAGCAIVATAVDGIPEVLEQGQAGLLVPPRDVTALSNALRELLSDPDRLSLWQERSQQNLDWLRVERVNEETLAVYREVLGGDGVVGV